MRGLFAFDDALIGVLITFGVPRAPQSRLAEACYHVTDPVQAPAIDVLR